ncbi:MAG: hypothetical protein ACI8PZ_000191 [Myxococcota bacterium]|jgi:hypothetical protein
MVLLLALLTVAQADDPVDTGDVVRLDGTEPTGRVLINEVLPSVGGADEGGEWIEIVNVDAMIIDLAGWTIEQAKSSWGVAYTFPPTLLAPGEYLVVGGALVPSADLVADDLDMGNATSNGDGVRLLDASGAVRDTVVYGPNNEDRLEDDVAEASSLAPSPPDDASIARLPDATDTDESGVDFTISPLPTPGAPNDAEVEDCGARATGVVINEIQANPEGSDEGLEWIELFNAGDVAEDLDGWEITGGTQPGGSLIVLEGLSLGPGEFLLLGGELVSEADVILASSLGNASSNSDGLVLEDCAGVPADVFVYGAPNDDGWWDESGDLLDSLAPKPQEGASLARIQDGYDTDRPGDDIVVQVEPSPGAPNPMVEPVVCEPSTGDVVLNEFLPNPASTDAGLEFIELYNRGTAPVSVAGWQIALATQTDDYLDIDVELPGGAVVPPGGFYVIGGEFVEEADVEAVFAIGNGTGGDGVRLYDCEGATVDTAVYGDDNEDGMLDDSDRVADPSPLPEEDRSLAREVDGADADFPDDWVVAVPTPGATNAREVGSLPDEETGCSCGSSDPTSAPPPSGTPGNAPGEGCSTAPSRYLGLGWAVGLLVLLRRKRS